MLKPRQDMLPVSLKGLEVYQLTDGDQPAAHFYMEAQVCAPDSQYVLLHTPANAHPSERNHRTPGFCFLLCDLGNHGELIPLIEEPGSMGPAIAPDGAWLYYFIDETEVNAGRLTLKRVRLDGAQRETMCVFDTPPKGASHQASYPRRLSTISADGARIAMGAFLGNTFSADAPWGILVFDLKAGTCAVIHADPTIFNPHVQYSRSTDPEASHDLLIQQNHGTRYDAANARKYACGDDGNGIDLHIIRDDGSNLRDIPVGRDGEEFLQGHQCWRGNRSSILVASMRKSTALDPIIEAWPAAHAGHIGRNTPNARRRDLTCKVSRPNFVHFGADATGKRLLTDNLPGPAGDGLFLGILPDDDREDFGLESLTYLLGTGSSWKKTAHVHPFLSPDGKMGFFNSDAGGMNQTYMVKGWR